MLLVEEFFECYSLPDIRHYLREWLYISMLQKETIMEDDFVMLHDAILRLVEASWLLRKEAAKVDSPLPVVGKSVKVKKCKRKKS